MKLFTKDIDKKLFAQFEKGSDLENQMVVAKIFNPYGRGVWYILNSDPSDPDYLWAIVDLFDVEAGSVSRSELESIKVPPFRLPLERDMYFEPINAAELYRGLRAGKTYAEGGEISIEAQNKDMLLNYAEELEHHVEEFEEAAKGAEKVMPWVIAKIERASTDLSDVTHYLASENEKRREYGDGEGEEEYANGGEVKWENAHYGDNALVVSENKMGVIIKPYGRKFHLKFADGTEKTYDANELKFFKDMDDFDMGGEVEGVDLFEDYENIPEKVQQILDNYADAFEDGDYKGLEKANKALLEIGYTFDYGLDGQAYDLRKVGEKGKSDSYARGGEITVKVGDRVRQRKKVGSSVVYGIDGIVYETNGITFKLKDKYGNKSDKIYLTSSFKKSDIKSMADGGGTQSLDEMYKDLENKRTNIRLKIASVVGIDKALEYINRDYVINPFRLIESAVTKGFITIDEIDEKLWDAATEEAYDVDSSYRGSGEGIGSSDMNAFISNMLNSAGINIQVVENRYQRMSLGGMTAGRWYRDKSGEEFRFIGKVDSGENKDKLLFTDGQKKVFKTLDDFEGGRPKENKFFGLFPDGGMMAMGGKVKFADKVKSIKASLLERKKVSPKVQKDYGKTYSPKEAEESAKRIVGAMTAKERLMAKRKKGKK